MERLTTTVSPKALLTLYSDNYIDYRKINPDGSVSASRPLYDDTVKAIFSNIRGDFKIKKFKGIIPSNILYVDPVENFYVWYQKPQIKALVHTDKKYSGEYALPGLLFKVQGNSVSVVAVKGFKPKSGIFKAPFTNVGTTQVCMGSASLKRNDHKYIEDFIEYAEGQFFGSAFSHSPGEYHLLGFGKKEFPVAKLSRISKKTIKDFINGKL